MIPQGVFVMALIQTLNDISKTDLAEAKRVAIEHVQKCRDITEENRARCLRAIHKTRHRKDFMLMLGNFTLSFQGLKTLGHRH
jgi:hypothetical protein